MITRARYYRINFAIQALTVRLLDESGKQIGIFNKNEALRRARELNVDLVEIAPGAKPPVCKLIDFKKFKYLESKKERDSKKKIKNVEIKQIVLSPFIGKHDFDTKENQGRAFLTAGHKLKIIIKFKGREFEKKNFGYEVINRIINNLSDITAVERPPYQEGRTLVSILVPNKKRSQNETENQDKKSSQ